MKKFLIFLVSIVIVVCIGLTTFYFLRNDEVISIEKKEIYCNAGDTISLESLGISIKKDSKRTTFNYNAGGEEVTKLINYDADKGAYVVAKENAGGEVTVVISTTNKKYAQFTITVHIGNGSIEHPYYVFSESELSKIGNVYAIDSHYSLMNDISLSNNFKTIGAENTVGFGGSFNGNGYTINGLTLSNTADKAAENGGLFASIAATGSVYNLKLNGAKINGYYTNLGVLAGTATGTIDKVSVTNSTITNLSDASCTGILVGKVSNLAAPLKMSYVENSTVTIGSEDAANITSANVGGLVGKIEKTTVTACYANNVELKATNATVNAGGFVGEFVIGPKVGSIQQSYANANSEIANYAAFINTISKDGDFTENGVTMLRHLIGNFAIVPSRANADEVVDTDLVKNYDATYFVNNTYPDSQVFLNVAATQYLIRGFASVQEVLDTNEYIFFAIDSKNITKWDTQYVWTATTTALPTLRMGSVNPSDPSAEYLAKSLEKVEIDSNPTATNGFKTLFSGKDVADYQFTLTEDVDLSEEVWVPATLNNVVIDGQGKTITLKLGSVDNATNYGIFSEIENSTIKNLNIVILSVEGASTEYAGGLVGTIVGGTGVASEISNVNITYQTPVTTSHKNFGGIAGKTNNTNIVNCSVNGLQFGNDAVVENAAGVVVLSENNSSVKETEVNNSTIKANAFVGGIVANNKASVLNASGEYFIVYSNNATTATESSIGGIAGLNQGTIQGSNITVKIEIKKADAKVSVGGVAARNSGTIKNTQVDGEGIQFAAENVNVEILAGGIAAENLNNGKIEQAYNYLTAVGTYVYGKNYTVGGITAINSGKISQAVASSNIYGNKVAGIAYKMDNTNATADQVFVGKYSKESNTYSENEISGDKYVAGVVVELKSGSVTNVQTVSKIVGQANTTRSSLVTLIFPYGASLKNATIDNTITGNGTKYRETWKDFCDYSNRAEFGYTEEKNVQDLGFNIYVADGWHGEMQSVVINTSNSGVSDTIAAMGNAFALSNDYSDTSYSSYVRYVNDSEFNDVANFSGEFTFVACISSWFKDEKEFKRTLTFGISTQEVANVWMSNNGIILSFLVK